MRVAIYARVSTTIKAKTQRTSFDSFVLGAPALGTRLPMNT